MLWDIVRLIFRHPILAQSCLIGLFTSAAFTNFWTTLIFLLAGPPYHYNPFVIGLFGLIRIGVMLWGLVFSRTFMDKHEPLAPVIVGLTICLGWHRYRYIRWPISSFRAYHSGCVPRCRSSDESNRELDRCLQDRAKRSQSSQYNVHAGRVLWTIDRYGRRQYSVCHRRLDQ